MGRLTGVDMIEEEENYCVVKQITEDSGKNFDVVFRKIFFQLEGIFNDLIKSLKKNDYVLMNSIEEQHDVVTKFVSYCLRLLNTGQVEKGHRHHICHILKNIDLIVDILKYFTRYVIENKIKFSKDVIVIIEDIADLNKIYSKIFFDYKEEYLVDFDEKRENIKKLEAKRTYSKRTYFVYLLPILEVERDMVATRLGMLES